MNKLNSEHKGLKLPPLYIELVEKGKWKSPGTKEISQIIPYLNDPLIFIDNQRMLELESRGFPNGDDFMREGSGKTMNMKIELPWIDVDYTIFIAVNKQIGDDIGVALDYRESLNNPRVVASKWTKDGVVWDVVADSFIKFVELLKIK